MVDLNFGQVRNSDRSRARSVNPLRVNLAELCLQCHAPAAARIGGPNRQSVDCT